MRYRLLLAVGLCALFGWRLPSADACGFDFRLHKAARDAVAEDRSVADKAIHLLRDAGPEGLEALINVHAKEIQAHTAPMMARESQAPPKDDPAWQRLRTALDAVAGQRDCHTAELYWYTDFEAAKQAAQAEGKPILSLRLLGNLTDEFSCANSRFFRTTLYANQEVSRMLREHFILHWKSVRPVPKVTIDFGDGRKLERTLTGNSIHYVLDSQGRVVDALPGLYGPQAFLHELEHAEAVAKQTASLPDAERFDVLAKYHRERGVAILQDWKTDLQTLGISPAETAETAFASATTDDVWKRIAGLHTRNAELDQASIALIRSQHPTAAKAAPRAITKMYVEDPLVRMVRSFQGAVALDTVRNEYTFHRQIHTWLAEAAARRTNAPLDPFNERVYAELFLTPSSDPWLGLMPADVYTALEANGIVTTSGGK